MEISQLHIVAERFKQGLLAVATDGDYNNNDYSLFCTPPLL